MYKSNYGINWPELPELWKFCKFYDKDGTEIIPKTRAECSSLCFRKDVTRNDWKPLAEEADSKYAKEFNNGCVEAVRKMMPPDSNVFTMELSKLIAEVGVEEYFKYYQQTRNKENEVHPVEEFLEDAYNKYKHLLEAAKSSYSK